MRCFLVHGILVLEKYIRGVENVPRASELSASWLTSFGSTLD